MAGLGRGPYLPSQDIQKDRCVVITALLQRSTTVISSPSQKILDPPLACVRLISTASYTVYYYTVHIVAASALQKLATHRHQLVKLTELISYVMLLLNASLYVHSYIVLLYDMVIRLLKSSFCTTISGIGGDTVGSTSLHKISSVPNFS